MVCRKEFECGWLFKGRLVVKRLKIADLLLSGGAGIRYKLEKTVSITLKMPPMKTSCMVWIPASSISECTSLYYLAHSLPLRLWSHPFNKTLNPKITKTSIKEVFKEQRRTGRSNCSAGPLLSVTEVNLARNFCQSSLRFQPNARILQSVEEEVCSGNLFLQP